MHQQINLYQPVFRKQEKLFSATALLQIGAAVKKPAGFALTESVVVLIILALLGAMAVPRFVDVSNDALVAARNGSVAAVHNGYAMAIAQLKRVPQLGELVTFVGGHNVAVDPANKGVQVTINGTAYVVQTYMDTSCTAVTGAATDTVSCVGEIL
jgi:type II secretory pathway pseudopilin PulG